MFHYHIRIKQSRSRNTGILNSFLMNCVLSLFCMEKNTKKKGIRLYNIIFPVWLLVWIPTWLWLLIIPANYLVDHFVLKYCLKKLAIEDRELLKKNTWKVCLLGFAADLAGSVLLFSTQLLPGFLRNRPAADMREFNTLINNIAYDCFADIRAFLIVAFCVLVSGYCIYRFDKAFLDKYWKKEKTEQAKYIALRMAIFTMPYLFFIPVRWLGW